MHGWERAQLVNFVLVHAGSTAFLCFHRTKQHTKLIVCSLILCANPKAWKRPKIAAT